MQNMKSCRCPHHSFGGVSLVLLALTLFLGNYGIIEEHTASIIWPIFLGLFGASKAFGRRCACCSGSSCCPTSGSEGMNQGKCC
ncbi:MAG: hypothetical protein WCK49_02270 [Myxococcaceae bacterium]